jgi:ABC-type amino acid transport substrate-binding protein/ABC-type amino acid transport system permease subunit
VRVSFLALVRSIAAVAGLVAALAPQARAAQSPDAALAAVLSEARADARTDCAKPGIDRLVAIFCDGRIRFGVRDYYPLFGTLTNGVRHGYEFDIANAIAQKLGVEATFAKVNAASRIPMVDNGQIDLAIATMGHTVQRDGQIRFIRPHYYRSETILVGPKELDVPDLQAVRGRTVCASVGNGSNLDLISHGARLMLFSEADMLPDRLRDQTCALAAQDDSFFADYFTDPDFASRFSAKFGFVEVPWGMGVALKDSDRFARALSLMSQIFHRDGVFLAAARSNHISTAFLEQQRKLWAEPQCDNDGGSTNPSCVLPSVDTTTEVTRIAGQVAGFEAWMAATTGVNLELPMLKTMPAWDLFEGGIVDSLILIAGALGATLLFALVFGAAAGSRFRLLRWPARMVTIALQSTPIVLTLIIVAAIMDAMVPYSATVALTASITALGLANGCNAGQAIAEAVLTLRAEGAAPASAPLDLFVQALARSATQVVAFLINAAKGTPIASLIGAPELLSALTDISSFSSGRATIYTILLVFYTVIVMIVVWLCRRFERRLVRSYTAA